MQINEILETIENELLNRKHLYEFLREEHDKLKKEYERLQAENAKLKKYIDDKEW